MKKKNKINPLEANNRIHNNVSDACLQTNKPVSSPKNVNISENSNLKNNPNLNSNESKMIYDYQTGKVCHINELETYEPK
jgi:predicted aldo/keto reductase-like oxidoreductase